MHFFRKTAAVHTSRASIDALREVFGDS